MKMVIDIPEEEYKCVQITGCIGNKTCISNAIYNGTPLPKGYGDLIDKDRLLDELEKTVKSVGDNRQFLFWNRAVAHVHLSEPIIEADKGVENES